ncbi:MAG: hypothetical protein QG643_2435 [Pseudomonadota bacterium]|nr:hypothetical protein [Pseudomonadota bacterium]
MALYSDLPIYKHGCDLLALALEVQTQLPRAFKRSLGEKVHSLCMDMLEDMAMANAARGQERLEQIDRLLTRLRAATAMLRVGHEMRAPQPLISHKLWARSVELLDAVGAQAGGWRKQTLAALKAPAA